MNCPTCERVNPGDAQFCIYCANRMTPVVPTATVAPATGPTTRLDPAVVPTYTMPAAPVTATRQASPSHSSSRRWQASDATPGIWLIGIGVLLLTGSFFPGILVLIGLTQYMKESGRGRYAKASQSLAFFLGLATIFWLGLSWPLILLWGGLLMILNKRHVCIR